jgi:hypothetical protein
MESSDPAWAARSIGRLEARLRDGEALDGTRLRGVWEAFAQLLHHRGYFVSTSDETGRSLREIREVGEGFDLFDLARALARLDLTVTECTAALSGRLFPLLLEFAPACDCGRHRR